MIREVLKRYPFTRCARLLKGVRFTGHLFWWHAKSQALCLPQCGLGRLWAIYNREHDVRMLSAVATVTHKVKKTIDRERVRHSQIFPNCQVIWTPWQPERIWEFYSLYWRTRMWLGALGGSLAPHTPSKRRFLLLVKLKKSYTTGRCK